MAANENHNNEILQPIPLRDLPALRDVYRRDWPYNAQAHRFLDTLVTWLRRNPRADILVTCPNGDWRSDGTFVAIVKERTYNIYFFTLDRSCRRLTEALRQTRLIDWNKGPYICAVHEDHDEPVMRALREVRGRIEFDIESTCWWLPKEIALQYSINCPSDVYISPLSPSHSPIINSIWPHSFPGSEHYLANLITTFGGYGVFTKSSNELCSWVMLNDFGAVAILQTLQQHKRKGYAAILVKLLAKQSAVKDGCDSVTYIVRKNIVSQTLFKSLGFKFNNNVRWVQFKKAVTKKLDLKAHL